MRTRVTRSFAFEAAHELPWHPGKHLNDFFDNPTAALPAHDVWKRLEAAGLPVARLRLWETSDSSVELSAEP